MEVGTEEIEQSAPLEGEGECEYDSVIGDTLCLPETAALLYL